MQLIYTRETGNKGFVPCSSTYQRQIIRAMELGEFQTVEDMFRQAHRAVWRKRLNDEAYDHVVSSRRGQTITSVEYERLDQLAGNQITPRDVRQQCGDRDPNNGSFRSARLYFGPQNGVMFEAFKKIARLQKESYANAETDGWKVNEHKGPGVYAPSPFSQHYDEEAGYWKPDNITQRAGLSGGACIASAECPIDHSCENGVCVLDSDKRTCPAFQYYVNVPGQGVVHNLSARRMRKIRKYSTYQKKFFDTCAADYGEASGKWIPAELKTYLGIDFNVVEIGAEEWNNNVERLRVKIHRDPSTNAPFYVAASNGENMRFYRKNSAFTPQLDISPYVDGQVPNIIQVDADDDDFPDLPEPIPEKRRLEGDDVEQGAQKRSRG